jgi:hypothetical protein
MKTPSRRLLVATITCLVGTASCFEDLRLVEVDAGVGDSDAAPPSDGPAPIVDTPPIDQAASVDVQATLTPDAPGVDGPREVDATGAGGSDAGPAPSVCTPTRVHCGADQTPETCSPAGEWKPGSRCPFLCSGAGVCTGMCLPGSKRCGLVQTLTPELCDDKGNWVAQTPCLNLCSSGSCGGSCMPGTKHCGANQTPETCSPQGTWEPGQTCAMVCQGNGVCGGDCRPDSKGCSDLVPRTCDSAGHWQAATPCSFACMGGSCAGSCKPGSHRCGASGTAVETCDADANTWSQTDSCGVGCDTVIGACKACNGGTPDKCTGKCTSLQSDAKNCGACGHDCGALAHVAPGASVSCSSGHCVIPTTSCGVGYGHCGGGPPDNGCETNIAAETTCGCTGCATGQACAPSGASYTCSCGPSTPDACPSKCVDFKSDASNCGACSHSCFGGACADGVCQPVQIYMGNDVQTDAPQFVPDGPYLYFRRIRTPSVTVLARIHKEGGTIDDLTTDDIGSIPGLAIVNGKIYWPQGDTIRGCSLPDCTSPVTVMNQPAAYSLFGNDSNTLAFWAITDGADQLLMTAPSSPQRLTKLYFARGVADGGFAYVRDSVQLTRISLGGVVVPVGSTGDVNPAAGVAVNSTSVFIVAAGDMDADGGIWPGLFRFSLAKVGAAQKREALGFDTVGEFNLGVVADENNVYWLNAYSPWTARLVRCRAVGCGPSPTFIWEHTVSFPQGWIAADAQSVYWVTDLGFSRVAKP